MMKSAKIILFVLSAGFLIFSFLFILAGFSLASNFVTGIILAGVGFGADLSGQPDQDRT